MLFYSLHLSLLKKEEELTWKVVAGGGEESYKRVVSGKKFCDYVLGSLCAALLVDYYSQGFF